LDSAIQKSIIYANFASGTPPHPECTMIYFWIDESVAHSQIPKLWGPVSKFTKLSGCSKKIYRGAGRNCLQKITKSSFRKYHVQEILFRRPCSKNSEKLIPKDLKSHFYEG